MNIIRPIPVHPRPNPGNGGIVPPWMRDPIKILPMPQPPAAA